MVTDTVRIMNATNSPYGVDNVNNDFHYTIYNVKDDKYKRILAYDIRKNDMYMIVKNNNIWGAWAKLATMDKVAKYPDYSRRITMTANTWVATEDVYVILSYLSLTGQPNTFTIDGINVAGQDSSGETITQHFSGYVKKGSTIICERMTNANIVKVFALT